MRSLKKRVAQRSNSLEVAALVDVERRADVPLFRLKADSRLLAKWGPTIVVDNIRFPPKADIRHSLLRSGFSARSLGG